MSYNGFAIDQYLDPVVREKVHELLDTCGPSTGLFHEFEYKLAKKVSEMVPSLENPQNVGSVGAAAVMAVGMGIIPSLESVNGFIPVENTYTPDAAAHEVYNHYYGAFRKLYAANKKLYRAVSRQGK